MLEQYLEPVIAGQPSWMLVVTTLIGIVILIGGGELLVQGASRLATRLGVSPLVVGMTVVSFGTSAPELAVNVFSVLDPDKAGICFGNIVGSNIANIGLVAGITAMIRPIHVEKVLVTREIPMMLLATLAVLVLAHRDQLVDVVSAAGTEGAFQRPDALLLLLFFAVFLYYTISEVMLQRDLGATLGEVPTAEKLTAKGVAADVGMILLGLTFLMSGADVTVTAASTLAEKVGVPKSVIGLTLVALGTSLPELVTSVVASLRGNSDLAIGNIVGSNIFNLLFILGVTGTVSDVPVPEGGLIDLYVVLALSVVLFVVTRSHRRNVVRWEGMTLLLSYVAYMSYIAFGR